MGSLIERVKSRLLIVHEEFAISRFLFSISLILIPERVICLGERFTITQLIFLASRLGGNRLRWAGENGTTEASEPGKTSSMNRSEVGPRSSAKSPEEIDTDFKSRLFASEGRMKEFRSRPPMCRHFN